MKPAPQPTLFPAPPRESKLTKGLSLRDPAHVETRQASGSNAGAGYETPARIDVAIYELTTIVGPWPRWLCKDHRDKREKRGQYPKKLEGATVTECDDCLRETRR